MRIRQIKPEFWEHTGLGKLSRDHRLLFAGLWCMADCEGRLDDNPEKIKAKLFPYDRDIDENAVDIWLLDLADHSEEFITRIEGRIQINNFKDSELLSPKPRNNRAAIPIYVRREVLSVGICLLCRTTERLTVDHIRPLAKGGNNDRENLQCLCMPCNSRKRDKWEGN